MRNVARANNCSFIDITQLWGGSYAAAVAKGYMGADPAHPVQAGHDNYFQVIRDFLIA